MKGLSVSRLVNVTVTLTPPLAQVPTFNSILVLGTSTVIDVVTRMRAYNDIDAVATDFGTTSEEYLSAVLWFEQSPKPSTFYCGRWAKTASKGQLLCGPLALANRVVGPWAAIVDGGFHIAIDAGVGADITGLDFSAETNLNGVAGVIQTAIQASAGGTGVTCVYDAAFTRFVITSSTTGTTSKISFLTPAATGTDVSAMMAGTNTAGNGAFVADGIAAETALAAVTAFHDKFSSQWYGLFIPSAVDADHEDVANFVEACDPPHFYGVATQEGGCLIAGDTANIAYTLQQMKLSHCMVQYSSANKYSVMSALGRVLTTDWLGNNTTITLMYKQEPGIVPETLSASEADALIGFNCNFFVNYNNGTAILQNGICPSGQFVDSIIGCDWLRATIQTNVWNLLYGTNTKIPQTDAGMHILATGIEAACIQAVTNGLVAPGVWNSGGFGQLKQGDYLSKGYYVYTPPVASQAQSDRSARKSVPFQVAVKLAGAVHSVDVAVNVNP